MKKFKSWVEKKLGITELKSSLALLERRLAYYENLTQIGVDVHHYGESWAVVCVAGKSEYVNFVNLGKRDAEELLRIFKHFSNKLHDTPPHMTYLRW